MKYELLIFGWKVRATIIDIWLVIKRGILFFVLSVLHFIRVILFMGLSVLYVAGIIGFLVSFYYIYLCYKELQMGVSFFEMENLKMAALLFFGPIVISILKEFVRPK